MSSPQAALPMEDALKFALPNSDQPLAIVLAGHNGSGKSTLWYGRIADQSRIPLINADRILLSLLPPALPGWALVIRDHNTAWMGAAQRGSEALLAQVALEKLAFGVETVFSYWQVQADGTVRSKISLIRSLQEAGYYVLLIFVGLASVNLSIGRVRSRIAEGGHSVPAERLRERFTRTQQAIRSALGVADAAILCDNSTVQGEAFTIAHIRKGQEVAFDIRCRPNPPKLILRWLDVVAPEWRA